MIWTLVLLVPLSRVSNHWLKLKDVQIVFNLGEEFEDMILEHCVNRFKCLPPQIFIPRPSTLVFSCLALLLPITLGERWTNVDLGHIFLQPSVLLNPQHQLTHMLIVTPMWGTGEATHLGSDSAWSLSPLTSRCSLWSYCIYSNPSGRSS